MTFTGYKTVELTEEQVEKRQQRAKKRRQQAQEKREKDKVKHSIYGYHLYLSESECFLEHNPLFYPISSAK